MPTFEWNDVAETESHLMSDLRMCEVYKRGDEFRAKVINNGRLEFHGIADSLADGKSFVEQFIKCELNETNMETGGDGMARRKSTAPVAVAEREKEVREEKVGKLGKIDVATTSIGDLMKKNEIIGARIERNLVGASADLAEAVKAYTIKDDNTWDDIEEEIVAMISKVNKKLKFKTPESQGEGTVVEIKHNTEQQVQVFDVNEDPYIKDPLGLALPLGKLATDSPSVNVVGGWKLGNIVKAEYPKFYGIVSKDSEGREGGSVEGCIKLSRNKIEISIDLPLSMMFGTLSVEKLKILAETLVEEYEVRFDTIGGMKKFLKETLKAGQKKFERDSQEFAKQIDEYQTRIVETTRNLRAVEDNLEIMRSRKTPEKIIEEFRPLIGKVIKDDILFNPDGSFTVVYPDVRLTHKKYEYRFGDIGVKFSSNGTVRGVPELSKCELDPQQKSRINGYITPHLRSTGEFCLGNYTQVMADFLLRSELAATVSLMGDFLSSYNEASPFTPIVKWKKDEDYKLEGVR